MPLPYNQHICGYWKRKDAHELRAVTTETETQGGGHAYFATGFVSFPLGCSSFNPPPGSVLMM